MEQWLSELTRAWFFANGLGDAINPPIKAKLSELSFWLLGAGIIGLVGFFIYRWIDLRQLKHIGNATQPTDLEGMTTDLYEKKRKRKKSRFWKMFLSRTFSWGLQFVYVIVGMPFLVGYAKAYLSDGLVYMGLMGIGWLLNMFLTKIFSLWTPALPFRFHVQGRSWQKGLMIWQAWGMVAWAGPVYFLATLGPTGWMGSVAFLWVSQILQLVFFIYTTKKKLTPYQQYEGLSDAFKENLHTYLQSQDISDDEVGVLSGMKMGPNAFATGIFGYRMIAMTEELVKGYQDPTNSDFILKLSDESLESVIAHEVGHIKGYHVLKSVAFGAFFSSLTTIAIYYLFSKGGLFSPHQFLFASDTGAQIFSFYGQSLFNVMLMYPLTFIMISLTRKHEWEADTHLLNTNGCKKGYEFFHQIRHIAPVSNDPLWDRCNSTHPAPEIREKRMKKWSEEHC